MPDSNAAEEMSAFVLEKWRGGSGLEESNIGSK
jgi:hypothetical protein